MPKITDEEFNEYQSLIKWAKREKVYKSAKDTTRLEDDIDEPVKNCVAMLALLGCQPVYSCCGFDYTGQPFHKSHQYGRPYFMLRASPRTDEFLIVLSKQKTIWFATPNGFFVNIELMAGMNPHWRREECIHFSEECVLGIHWMERFLWNCRSGMLEEIVLEDTNNKVKMDVNYWQYPPKEPWLIKKSEIESRFTKM